MSKRRISKKQNARIEKRQQLFQSEIESYQNAKDGLVITRYGAQALIEDADKNLISCQISPSIDNLVAGDKVIWIKENNNQQGLIVSRNPRKSALSRPVKGGKTKVVAANITQMIVVLAPKPEINWSLLDSYLVMAELMQLTALIVLNKTDMPCTDEKNKLEEQYKTLGYDVLYTNHHGLESLKPLKAHLTNQVSVFVGQSGVGKSSLISSMLPSDINIQISHIAEKTALGRHTTSNSTYYHLETLGAIIDSPGVREFGLWNMPASQITQGYKEFKPFLSHCKFRDCDHQHSPGCALQQAVKEKKIFADRLKNYVKIRQKFAT